MLDFLKRPKIGGYVPNPEQDNDPRNLAWDEMVPFGGEEIEPFNLAEEYVSFNQGRTSSCTSQAFATVAKINGDDLVSPRYAFHKIKTDSAYGSSRLTWGAYVADPFRLMSGEGICDYDLAPNEHTVSDVAYLDLDVTDEMRRSAKKNKGGKYAYVTRSGSQLDIFDALVRYMATEKRAVALPILWRKSYNKRRSDGIIPAVYDATGGVGHVIAATGYTVIDGHEYIIAQNSYGEGWGTRGQVYLPKGFFHAYSTVVWLPDERAQELEIKTPDPWMKDGVERNIHAERANAHEVNQFIEHHFPLDVPADARRANQEARSYVERNKLMFTWGVVYNGYTFRDVINHVYAVSRKKKKKKTKAYSMDFSIKKKDWKRLGEE